MKLSKLLPFLYLIFLLLNTCEKKADLKVPNNYVKDGNISITFKGYDCYPDTIYLNETVDLNYHIPGANYFYPTTHGYYIKFNQYTATNPESSVYAWIYIDSTQTEAGIVTLDLTYQKLLDDNSIYNYWTLASQASGLVYFDLNNVQFSNKNFKAEFEFVEKCGEYDSLIVSGKIDLNLIEIIK